jgi:uncharacterized protein with HEPN domain
MSPEEGDPAYLWDMLDAARRVVEFTRGIDFAAYVGDPMRRMAVERALEILGEAARRVSESFRKAHPEIPWRDLVGQRNVLAHDYGEIKQDRIWETATQHAPGLIGMLEPLLPPPPPETGTLN